VGVNQQRLSRTGAKSLFRDGAAEGTAQLGVRAL
jgi:hypothetical protein